MEGGDVVHLDPFELFRPDSVEAAVGLASRLGPGSVDFLAGGTDLLPNYKMHLNPRPNLVALWDIPELARRSPAFLGSMTRLNDLVEDAQVASAFPGVVAAACEVATPLVRSSATVGGNLLVETRCFFFNQSFPWRQSLGFCLKAEGDRCHVVPQRERCYATFSGDLAPALMAVDASVEVAGPAGRRRVTVEELYDPNGDGIRRHRLAPGEILVGAHLPHESRGLSATYRKLRVRPAFDFPELGVAVALRTEGADVSYLRVAVGGLETYPRRFDALTDPVVGHPLTDDRIAALGEAVRAAVHPVHNTFLAPEYRRKMAGVFVRRALREARDASTARPAP